MKKYKALKDVPYWRIKAGEVYEEEYNAFGQNQIQTSFIYLYITPLLEAGIIEEVPERLTVENIKIGQEFWYVVNEDVRIEKKEMWDGSNRQISIARFGIFHTAQDTRRRVARLCGYSKELDAKNE